MDNNSSFTPTTVNSNTVFPFSPSCAPLHCKDASTTSVPLTANNISKRPFHDFVHHDNNSNSNVVTPSFGQPPPPQTPLQPQQQYDSGTKMVRNETYECNKRLRYTLDYENNRVDEMMQHEQHSPLYLQNTILAGRTDAIVETNPLLQHPQQQDSRPSPTEVPWWKRHRMHSESKSRISSNSTTQSSSSSSSSSSSLICRICQKSYTNHPNANRSDTMFNQDYASTNSSSSSSCMTNAANISHVNNKNTTKTLLSYFPSRSIATTTTTPSSSPTATMQLLEGGKKQRPITMIKPQNTTNTINAYNGKSISCHYCERNDFCNNCIVQLCWTCQHYFCYFCRTTDGQHQQEQQQSQCIDCYRTNRNYDNNHQNHRNNNNINNNHTTTTRIPATNQSHRRTTLSVSSNDEMQVD